MVWGNWRRDFYYYENCKNGMADFEAFFPRMKGGARQ
jgi:hypothetical protein